MPSGRVFYLKVKAEENLQKLYTRDNATAAEAARRSVDGDDAPGGGHYSISFYVPSPDGKRVAYGLAASGSEQDVLHIIDVETGKALTDEIRSHGGRLHESAVARGRERLLLLALPPARRRRARDRGLQAHQVVPHRVGDKADNDRLAFAVDLWPNVTMSDVDFPSIVLTTGSTYAIGKIKHGDSNPLTLYAGPLGKAGDLSKQGTSSSPWKMVCDVADSVTDFAVRGSDIYLMTCRGASRLQGGEDAARLAGLCEGDRGRAAG